MMTLKYINGGGHEEVISLVSASFDPETKLFIAHGTPVGDRKLEGGRAFLMNENGKTVATYTLNK